MNGITPMLDEAVVTRELDVQNVNHVECVQQNSRHIMPVAGSVELSAGKELEKGYTTDNARAEADRCLQCGLVCYKRTELEKTTPATFAKAG
jgi:hypothetical protein